MVGLCVAMTAKIVACSGGYFPQCYTCSGDAEMLAAPRARFDAEVERLPRTKVKFHFQSTNNAGSQEALLADRVEFAAAMAKDKRLEEDKALRMKVYWEQREKLAAFASQIENWKTSLISYGAFDPRPESNDILVPTGVPAEFENYFAGSLAWNRGLTNQARKEWESLLELPEKDRQYRSTWAAYMLGKSWVKENPAKALSYFNLVRSMVEKGFGDSIELAASTYGWEAYTELHRQQFTEAIMHYLEAYAAKDRGVVESLRRTVMQALAPENVRHLNRLAGNAQARRVITAFLISRPSWGYGIEEETKDDPGSGTSISHHWLKILEDADIQDVELVEEIALGSYQNGEMESAQRWLRRASSRSPVVQWLQAKLFLRVGKLDQAASLLARVAAYFPLSNGETNPPVQLIETLIQTDESFQYRIPLSRMVFSELGILQLTQREYTEALQTLLSQGWLLDAAYVAERVLTVQELKKFVDQKYPPYVKEGDLFESNEKTHPSSGKELSLRERTRWVRSTLSRRYAREFDFESALAYVADEERKDLDQLSRYWEVGREEKNPSNERATALWNAAQLVARGGDLLFKMEGGNFWTLGGTDGFSRQHPLKDAKIRASLDEQRRFARHTPSNLEMFHRHLIASSLAWDAAAMMPNDSEETAQVLHTGGSWIKYRDPLEANLFYKSLVRRCRKTELGHASDLKRWFVKLDQKGDVIYPVKRGGRVLLLARNQEPVPENIQAIENRPAPETLPESPVDP